MTAIGCGSGCEGDGLPAMAAAAEGSSAASAGDELVGQRTEFKSADFPLATASGIICI